MYIYIANIYDKHINFIKSIYWSYLQAAQIQIELRKVEEAGRDKTSEVNEDIKKTGQLVVGLIDAAAKTQSTMYGLYNSIASKNKQGIFFSLLFSSYPSPSF